MQSVPQLAAPALMILLILLVIVLLLVVPRLCAHVFDIRVVPDSAVLLVVLILFILVLLLVNGHALVIFLGEDIVFECAFRKALLVMLCLRLVHRCNGLLCGGFCSAAFAAMSFLVC
jgi:hypothetical protein